MSQQELNGLREGFAQHGEAWLRERLREQSFPQARGLAGAAGLPRYSGRRKLSKNELEQALWRSIAEQEASEGMDVRDDDVEKCSELVQQRRRANPSERPQQTSSDDKRVRGKLIRQQS